MAEWRPVDRPRLCSVTRGHPKDPYGLELKYDEDKACHSLTIVSYPDGKPSSNIHVYLLAVSIAGSHRRENSRRERRRSTDPSQ